MAETPEATQAQVMKDVGVVGLDSAFWDKLLEFGKTVGKPILQLLLQVLLAELQKVQGTPKFAAAGHLDCNPEVVSRLKELLHSQCHTCCELACLVACCEGHDHA